MRLRISFLFVLAFLSSNIVSAALRAVDVVPSDFFVSSAYDIFGGASVIDSRGFFKGDIYPGTYSLSIDSDRLRHIVYVSVGPSVYRRELPFVRTSAPDRLFTSDDDIWKICVGDQGNVYVATCGPVCAQINVAQVSPNGELKESITLPFLAGSVEHLFMAVGRSESVLYYSTGDGIGRYDLSRHAALPPIALPQTYAMKFLPDGKLLATSGGGVYLLGGDDMELRRYTDPAVSPIFLGLGMDGTFFVASYSPKEPVVRFELNTGRARDRIEMNCCSTGGIRDFASAAEALGPVAEVPAISPLGMFAAIVLLATIGCVWIRT